jgi:hypothetical protein
MAHKNYAGPEWKAIRLQILERDNYVCQIRFKKCKIKANHVDHIVNIDDGGPRLDPSNLRAACASCNTAKRNTEVAARARQARTTPATPATEWTPPPKGVRTSQYGTWQHDGTWEPNSRKWTTNTIGDDGWTPPNP